MAADFSRQQNSMIGLIIFTVKSSIHAELIEGIQEELAHTRFSLIIANSMYRADRELRFLQLFRERKLSGAIVAEATDQNRDYIKKLRDAGMPVVITWEMTEDEGLDCFFFFKQKTAYEMTRYLIGLGHRNIGLILGDYQNIERVRHRFRGYCDALEESGVPLRDDYVISAEPSPQNGKSAMIQLLGRRPMPTAVFAASAKPRT
jgi:DNA-binding LacI/PurR family transcriptional regulator